MRRLKVVRVRATPEARRAVESALCEELELERKKTERSAGHGKRNFPTT